MSSNVKFFSMGWDLLPECFSDEAVSKVQDTEKALATQEVEAGKQLWRPEA
jgi:hypothetical protein